METQKHRHGHAPTGEEPCQEQTYCNRVFSCLHPCREWGLVAKPWEHPGNADWLADICHREFPPRWSASATWAQEEAPVGAELDVGVPTHASKADVA